ncbi:thymocyte selection-associated high mobility group box protein TOX [Aulostomus maculatus]
MVITIIIITPVHARLFLSSLMFVQLEGDAMCLSMQEASLEFVSYNQAPPGEPKVTEGFTAGVQPEDSSVLRCDQLQSRVPLNFTAPDVDEAVESRDHGEGATVKEQLNGAEFYRVEFHMLQPPQPPSKGTPPSQPPQPWRRDRLMADTHRPAWPYSLGVSGDEDFNIPPITPPTLPDHMLPPHLPHDSSLSLPLPPLDTPFSLQPMSLRGMPSSRDVAAVLNQDGGTIIPEGAQMSSALCVRLNLARSDGGPGPQGAPSPLWMQQMVNSDSLFTSRQQPLAAPGPRSQSAIHPQSHLPTSTQPHPGTHDSPSPPTSKSATPSPPSSAQEDDDDGLRQGGGGEKRPAALDICKKPKTPKKKKRKDPNEPVKPVSAYALFFRDTQANIKAQNPNATFGEVSKVVASMWDGLGEEQKQVYKKKTETAKKEYLKQLAAYRASLVAQSYGDPSEMKPPHPSSTSSSTSVFTSKPVVYAGHPGQHLSSSPLAHPHALPPPQHPGMYMSYPHPSHLSHTSSPILRPPHLPPPHSQMPPQLQALSSNGTVPRHSAPHQGALSLCSMVAASTPPHQISPPLQSQAHLGGLHSPHHQHQQLTGHALGMTHSPAITQGYAPSLQSDYQPMGGNTNNSGAVMSSSVDYHQLGRHTPNHQLSLDWSSDYHGNG